MNNEEEYPEDEWELVYEVTPADISVSYGADAVRVYKRKPQDLTVTVKVRELKSVLDALYAATLLGGQTRLDWIALRDVCNLAIIDNMKKTHR